MAGGRGRERSVCFRVGDRRRDRSFRKTARDGARSRGEHDQGLRGAPSICRWLIRDRLPDRDDMLCGRSHSRFTGMPSRPPLGWEADPRLCPRESPWGKRYSRVAQEGHPFYSHARFYTIDEVERLLGEAGFAVEGATSTLFQPPGHVERLEPPRPGRSGTAGFVVFRANT